MQEQEAHVHPSKETIEHAMSLWRDGEQLLAKPLPPAWRNAYEHAISRAINHLRRCHSMPDLLAAYFAVGAAERTQPQEDWLEHVIALEERRSSYILNRGIVEDVAFWRRARELVAGADR